MSAEGLGRTHGPALAALAMLAAAGCSRPDWTNPETSKGARALPAPKVKQFPTDPGGTPAPPAWVAPLLGKALRSAFPRDGVCVGNTDAVQAVFQGDPKGARIVGWAWEYGTKAPVPRVVLADAQDRIIGGGDSGLPRTDVPKVMAAVTSDLTGWQAVTTVTSGAVRAYGIVENGQAICPLAGAEL